MNSSVVCEKKGFQSEKKGEYTIQNFTQKGKRVTSWEANKQTKSTSTATKRARQTPQEMTKKVKIHFSLCEVEEEGFKEAKEKAHKEKKMKGVISIP